MNQTSILRPYVEAELAAARRTEDRALAWAHLERAHILSQPSAPLHTRVHFAMFLAALAIGDARELFGQVLRVLLAGAGSWAGRYPLGNTGRARVPINAPMPIAPDLQAILDRARAASV